MARGEFWFPEEDRIRRVRDGQVITYGEQKPEPNLVHAVSRRTTSHTNPLSQRLYLTHMMSNNHRSSDDKHYLLTFMGSVSSQTALPTGLVLADHGKSWRTTDTGSLWTWTGSAWFNQGARPTIATIGSKYLNPDDYYTRHFLSPPVSRKADPDFAYMGQNRDVPPFVPRRGGSTDAFYMANAIEAVREYVRLGVDGLALYAPEIGDTSVHWPRVMRWLRAAEQVQTEDGIAFPCVILPDGKTSSTASVMVNSTTVNIDASADALANQFLAVRANPALVRVDGKLVVGAFGPELWPDGVTQTAADRLTFWTRFRNTMAAGGQAVFFAPSFLGTYTTFMDAGWAAIVDMVNLWGDADPTATAGDNLRNRRMTSTVRSSYNKPTFFTVRPSDSRPREGNMWEEGGFDLLRQMFSNLRGVPGNALYPPAEWCHGVTGDDFAEGSQILPSPANGGTALSDYARYYLEWWKTGTQPAILRDGLYLRHRKHPFTGVTYTGVAERGTTSPLYNQTLFITKVLGSTAVRNEISVEARLTAPGTVRILIDGAMKHSQDCPAGVTPVRTALLPGRISVELIRSGVRVTSVTSNVVVSLSQPFQDVQPRTFSSLVAPGEDYLAPSTSGTASTVTWRTAGATTSTTTTVVCRTPVASSVRVRLRRADGAGTPVYSTAATPGAHGESKHVFAGLTAGTDYLYAVETDGALAAEDGKVRTFAPTGTFTLAVSSCQEINSNATVGSTIAARNPNLVVHLGDMHYRDPISTVDADIAGFWDVPLRSSNYRKMFGAGSLSYIWSDHDSGPDNNTATTSPARSTIARVYRKLFPHYPLPAGDNVGVYHTFALTDRVRFIMTDCRTYKTAQSAADDANKTILGATQKQWLKDTVNAAPTGTLFFVAFDVAGWVGTTANPGGDDWRSYFTERTELANFMKTSGKQFYVLVGDSHSEAYDNGTNSAHGGPLAMCSPLDQVNPGGGGSKPWTVGPVPPPGDYGTTRFHQFGLFEVTDTGTGSITVKFTGINGAGTTIIPTQTDLL